MNKELCIKVDKLNNSIETLSSRVEQNCPIATVMDYKNVVLRNLQKKLPYIVLRTGSY